jgi:hypothetical protein
MSWRVACISGLTLIANAEGALLSQDGMPRRVSLATVVGDEAMQSQP